MARTIYYIEMIYDHNNTLVRRELWEWDGSYAEFKATAEILANKTKTTRIFRVTRERAKQLVKEGVIHNTRFWVDGGTVRG